MLRRNRSRSRALAPIALLVVATGWSALGGVAFADETPKVAVVVTAPRAVGAGPTTAFTVTITNEAEPQDLGSANVTVPVGFVLLSTSDPDGPLGPITAVVNNSVVELRELALPPNGSVSVTVTAVAPCTPADTYDWAARVKQSNDFSGLPGNDFAIGAGSDLTTDVSGTCSVGFGGLSFAGQPTSAEKNTTITTATLDPNGDPVQVALLDAGGKVITEPSLQTTVTVAIDTNAGVPAGVLSGVPQEPTPTSGGIATFASLKINEPGLDYTLESTSSTTGITPGTSAEFDIVDDGGVCPSGGCNHSATLGSTSASFSSNSTQGGYNQFIALDVQSGLDCVGYTEVTAEVTWGASALSGTAQVTLTVQRSALPRSRRSLNSFQVCYGSFTIFTPRAGTTLPLPGPEFVALLPECADVAGVAPCVIGRTKTSRTYSITFSTPIGSTRGKG